ncbi:RagB/SusD family nutrient uptake outer membrane protein [Pedobacter frigiditerrae]|uniref:RagB/SusD family nutrient uptake outer membrane protein n=1 Tax=Pedobacter frigiditerrae TaxID=2530452 RepID=A0A4R0MP06_9SPHI|nr:RagB/SusD family nutrient uptake outer membrane protein [Pedobacter frigiditerrae]TCC87962.1 RagB/SusD family nutrient uptake outer membrane protein [Pedobacter frigiditerrae]
MSKSINKILLGCVVLLFAACEKTVEIDPPLNEITTAQVFSTDKLATSAMAGVYTGLASTTTQNNVNTVYSSLYADDLAYLAVNPTYLEVANNSYSALSTFQGTIFSEWYSVIYRANSVIEGLQKYEGTSAQVKKQLTAESKVIRAYCYFNLINTFGDVPLVLTTDVTISALQPKETVATIYKQIIADLSEGKANLLDNYSASSNTRLGVNKFVATALLARTYLFTGDYAAAESNASEVITASNLFSIIPAATMTTGVWTKNNPESIWQMSSPIAITNQYTVEAGTFLATVTTSPQFEIRSSLLQQFDSNDLRRKNWMRTYGTGINARVLPYKYKYATNAEAVTAGVIEGPTVLRLAEQYLIRAEARARIGTNITGARTDMNVIRTRAEATVSITTDPAVLLQEILLETRKEFFCEQTHRWFNIKRLGQADAILTALKPGYKPTSKLLPIPTANIDANPNLIQNPGY